MPDYQLGKIYQLICLTTGERYIGSTTEPTIARRLAGHCRTYKYYSKNGKGITRSYPIIERGNYQIELLETFPCNSKDELNAREGHYIRTLECVNKCIPGRTQQESIKAYYEANKEVILEKAKSYRDTNKEVIAEYQKAHYEANKEVILEKAKTHYQENKEAITERRKVYREKLRQTTPESGL